MITMRKILLRILTVILAICCIGLVACDKKPKDEATLVDFVNSTVDVPYGMNYKIAEYVFDTDGNRYALTANVTDNEGNAVEADRVFQVTKASYSVKYSVNFKGETVTKTVTVKGVSIPVITLDEREVSNTILDFIEARLPEIKAEDLIDGEIQDIQIEVYKQTAYANIKMTDYVEGSNKYLGKSLGEYYWKVTVTNTAGVTNERILFFECLPVTDWNFIPSVENATRGYSKDQQSSKADRTTVPVSYVAKADIPTEGIAAAGGYGDAIKFDNVNASEQRYITLEMNYSGKDYIAIAEKLNLPRIVYTYMIHTADDVVKNACYGESMYSMFSASGYHAEGEWHANNTAVTNLPLNSWQTKVIDVDDFAKAFLDDGSDLLVTRLKNLSAPNAEKGIEGIEADFYLGEIKMVGANYVANNGDLGIIPSATSVNSVFNLSSLNHLNTMVTTKHEVSFVEKANIPTEGITEGDGYGDAIKVAGAGNDQIYTIVKLNYTLEEYKKIVKNEGYKSVKFSYMIDSDYAVRNRSIEGEDTYTLLAAAGYYSTSKTVADPKLYVPTNIWQTELVEIEDFYKAIINDNLLMVSRFIKTDNAETEELEGFDFYLGSIEFVKDDASSHVPFKGEIGFTANEENVSRALRKTEKAAPYTAANASFVAKADIPEYDEGLTKVGDVIKFAGVKRDYSFVQLNYKDTEYEIISAREGYKSVKFSFLVTATDGTIRNECCDEFGIFSLLSGAGYHTISDWGSRNNPETILPTNVWQTALVSVEDFIKAIWDGDRLLLGKIYPIGASGQVDFYLGDIEFSTEEVGSLPMYKGEYGFTPSEENASKLFLKERELRAPSTTNKHSFVLNKDIATEGIDQGFGYTGDALKVSNFVTTDQTYVFLTLNYTVDEYKSILANTNYKAVKFSYMIDSNVSIKNRSIEGEGTYSLLAAAGYYTTNKSVADPKLVVPVNVWQTKLVEIEDFYKAIINGNELMVARFMAPAETYDFYLGNIEFVEDEVGSLIEYNGEFGFTPSEINTDKAFIVTSVMDTKGKKTDWDSFVTKENLPEVDEGFTTVGNAIKYANIKTSLYIYVTPNYTVEEYNKLLDSSIKSVKFTYMVKANGAVSNRSLASEEFYSILSAAGYHTMNNSVSAPELYLPTNVWQTELISIEDFYKAFDTSTNNAVSGNRLLISRINGPSETNPVDFYFGGFEFSTEEPGSLPVYKGEYGFTVNADNVSRTYVKEQMAHAPTYTASSLVTKENLPEVDEGFTTVGDSIKFASMQVYAYVKLNYTVEEYKQIIDSSYKSVKFTYMVKASGAVKNRSASGTYSLLSAAGYHTEGSDTFHALPINVWQTELVAIEDFYKAISGTDLMVARLSGPSATNVVDLYLGNIEFSTEEVGSLPVYKGEFGFTVNEANLSKVLRKDSISNPYTSTNCSLVAKEDLPKADEGFTTVGDSVKYANVKRDYSYVQLNYTAAELQEAIAGKGYKSVKFTYLVTATDGTIRNECSDESNMYSLLSAAGYHTASDWGSRNDPATILLTNVWQTELVTIENFFKAIVDNDKLFVARIYPIGASAQVDFYFGGFEFSTEEVGSLPIYKGEFGFTPSEANTNKAFLVTSKSDAAGKKNDMDSFVAKNDITTTGIEAGFGYGDAIKYSNITSSWYLYVTPNYTVEEYKEYLDPSYKSVKFTFMIDTDATTVRNECYVGGTTSILSGAGYQATSDWGSRNDAATILPINIWQTVLISIDDFYKAFETSTENAVSGSRLLITRIRGGSTTTPIDFYLGDIEFSTDEVGTLPVYNGVFGFTPSADNASKTVEQHDASYTQTYMAATELATLTQAGNSAGYVVDNSVGYQGGAIKLASFKGNGTPVGLVSNYTADELKVIYESGLLEGATVTFNVMVGSANLTQVRNFDYRTFAPEGNANHGDFSCCSLVSLAGHKTYNVDGTESGKSIFIDTNKWYSYTVDFDENFFHVIQASKAVRYNVITLDTSEAVDVYLGEIVFNLP